MDGVSRDRDREFMVALGQRLRAARGTRTQAQVALAVGLSRTSWVNVEQGRQAVTVAALARMAAALGVSVESLLPGSLTPFRDVNLPVPSEGRTLRARIEELERRLDGSTQTAIQLNQSLRYHVGE